MFQLPQHTYNYKMQMNANEILCWMLQLTQPVQLQNANANLCWMLQLFNLCNYKMLMIFYVGCFN